ncbi:hypothetical protein HETIRDRAFT_105666 [Heterobasidion irregulare TC 32-1]|uniref:Uncharacterized protein n=1 Tax=Heterobasidion irregulare (strain TC 32-1) TaxID=747525 RepID=W4JUE5_HETIT|nr:uncharacterized protein HETIRDRAFT_105666 [Heterobasidion irregulare TC 32-1]ETW77172.1 hypothetical protein HETIRDRAFT_105666 [Heterobasidion irregulare TC 32-1]
MSMICAGKNEESQAMFGRARQSWSSELVKSSVSDSHGHRALSTARPSSLFTTPVRNAASMRSQRASPADEFSLPAYVTRPFNCTTADVTPSPPRLSLFDAYPARTRLC